jgi:hypothetical protein
MGETRDLIGIYGAIDRAVESNPEIRPRVSRLLPVYRNEDVHWFEDFEAWTSEKREDAGVSGEAPPFPEPDEALEELSRIEPRGRMRARRLFAVAVAVQAFPAELASDGGWARRAQDALQPLTPTEDEGALELFELLGDENLLPPIDAPAPDDADIWWESLLAVASYNGLLADTATMGPRPCTGRLVMVDLPDGRGPVTTLRTEFETGKVRFERAKRFLDPENWPSCSNFWCEMTKVGVTEKGAHQYHEVVSTDCDDKDAAWTIQAELDFSFKSFPGAAITEYGLSAGHPKPGDDVVVDEGALEVRRLGADPAAKLRITTTKRIKFSDRHPFTGASLSMLMCALGYASVVEDLVFTCAASDTAGEGTPFPAEEPATAEPGPGPTPTIPDLGPAIKVMADGAAAAVKRCADEWSQAAQESSRKIADGAYDADALVQDMAGIWVRSVREGATAVELGIRSARETAGIRAGEPPRAAPWDHP